MAIFQRVPTYELSGEAEEALQKIAKDTGVSPGRALSEAIALLELVLEEKRKSNRIAIMSETNDEPEAFIYLEID